MSILVVLLIILAIIVLRSIRQIDEYQRGVLFTFGKFDKILNPGWHVILPVVQSFKKIDIMYQNKKQSQRIMFLLKLMQFYTTRFLMHQRL